ncbi:MAG: signal peptidase I [Candidatus Komeilibacteria bacterium CG_4_10_14_0_2_um_filter_37_10]|uniref:Signal peptidase I n=1 Tax=Candidatus Komeilibacteria bacterium CG_4_10_14_0_2_um_filter_37_10 TaxID=1974470 RepID=A0A2M7VDF3_9BACT|nr:MAG: signal peptidase I [Candidatus Komeilibacteria bacterium CG_4_10_14_0_2_um_filter_37_10]PJA93329.1 MAG: signal peptidase I [Candidatus Komeilibacteria bacterium CG_4_9_14_3_um_filter_37_5]
MDNLENQTNRETEKEATFKSFIFETIKVIIVSLIIVVPIRAYVGQPFYVDGASMEPNFHNGEYLIVDQISYRFAEPVRGDIVVFRPPTNDKVFYIKRLIGLPGETVLINNGKISVIGRDGKELAINEDNYLDVGHQMSETENYQTTLKENEFFVLGDNRRNSLDSRRIGPINKDEIRGKVLLRVLPINRFGLMQNPIY